MGASSEGKGSVPGASTPSSPGNSNSDGGPTSVTTTPVPSPYPYTYPYPLPDYSSSKLFVQTARPTIPFTLSPTTLTPTFADAGQACAVATRNGRAVTVALQTPNQGEALLLSRSQQLCTLWQVDAQRTRIIPVARSYEGNPWEPYSTALLSDVATFQCDSVTCSANLPELLPGHSYELAAFDHRLPNRDKVARFLEQATFGPTLDEIDAFPDSPADWVKEQQDKVPATLHREFYRARLNGRMHLPSFMGLPTQPCDNGARYRRFAFVDWDMYQKLEIRTDGVTKRKVLYRDGQARTVVNARQLIAKKNANEVSIRDGT